jgi:hypothetical protein
VKTPVTKVWLEANGFTDSPLGYRRVFGEGPGDSSAELLIGTSARARLDRKTYWS